MYETRIQIIKELFNLDWVSCVGSFVYNKSKSPITNRIHIIIFNTRELLDFWRDEYKPKYYSFLKELSNERNISIK